MTHFQILPRCFRCGWCCVWVLHHHHLGESKLTFPFLLRVRQKVSGPLYYYVKVVSIHFSQHYSGHRARHFAFSAHYQLNLVLIAFRFQSLHPKLITIFTRCMCIETWVFCSLDFMLGLHVVISINKHVLT